MPASETRPDDAVTPPASETPAASASATPDRPTAASRTPKGPRDVREAAFAAFLTEQAKTPGGDKIVRFGLYFLAAAAGLVVLLAIIASLRA